MSPGGKEPGPDGDGKCRPTPCELPIPGDGARRGGVARPKPESVSAFESPWSGGGWVEQNTTTTATTTIHGQLKDVYGVRNIFSKG